MKPEKQAQPQRRALLLALTAGATLPALQACAPLVVGGAATGAAMVYTDRRTSGAYVEDEGIEWKARRALKEGLGNAAKISVTSYNRNVLLTGQAPDEQMRKQAEDIVYRVDHVSGVANELQVAGRATLTEQGNDAMLTSMVKTRLFDSPDVPANLIKVVTELNTVYLMGIVTRTEADAATEVARTTRNVQKVVRVFEIISDEEAARLDLAAKNNPPQD